MQDRPPAEVQSAVIAFLADPATHGGAAVERIDTHGAIVFLAGDRACKLKRAVHYPYMDFSTVARREAACRAELAINRRTAPDLYRGVLPVRRAPDGRLSLCKAGEGADDGTVLDWVVVMRRFDQAALFDALAARGALDPDLMEDLAEAVAAFHGAAERHPEASPAALRWVIEENIQEFRDNPALFPPAGLAHLAERAGTALDRRAGLIERRTRAGFVRRCHGDLHLRNVVLLDGRPTLFDAIEFNDALAIIDVFYDLAFLLMDLDQRGLRALGNRVLNRYLVLTGDHAGLALLPLFLSTRAAVRAKVAASTAATLADPAAAERQRAAARAYFAAALDALTPPPARLVAIGGLSGSGKTTAAHALAPGLGPAPGAVILRSDVIRKRLFGVPERQRLPEEGYRPEVTAEVYAEIDRCAAAVLAAGHAAIADAVFARPEERAAIEAVARRAGVPFTGCWLEAPRPALEARVARRAPDASDADAHIVALQSGYDTGPLTWPRIDASAGPAQSLGAIQQVLGED